MPREIFVVHRHDPRNIGDMSCAPSSYLHDFPWLAEATTIDIETEIDVYAERLGEANVIYGGGGLLGTTFFDRQLRQLIGLRPHKLICWSAGLNSHGQSQVVLPDYMDAFDLVGIRDDVPGAKWVPCVSAMIPALSGVVAPEHDIVVYRHWDDYYAGLLNDDKGYPVMRNNVADLQAVLAFLASGRTVVTNSYHGAYWATLMGRRVVIVSPFSNKFLSFRWHIPVVQDGDWEVVARSRSLRVEPDALRLCRRTNRLYGNVVQRCFAD